LTSTSPYVSVEGACFTK